LSESVLLALPGGALGLIVASQGTGLVIRATPQWVLDLLPGYRTAGVDGRVLWVTLLVSLLTAAIFGLVPALHSARKNIRGSLGEVGRTSTPGSDSSKLTKLLAGAEVALAFVLLLAAGLMLRTLAHLTSSYPGFDPQSVLTAQLALPQAKYKAPSRRAALFQEVLDKVRALPGVDSAGEIDEVPLGGNNSYWSFQVGGSSVTGPDDPHDSRVHFISPSCLEALRIPVLEGRSFDEHDREGAAPVAVVNQRMARLYWPETSAIGKQILVGKQWTTIVGVAGNVLNSGNFWADTEVYLPNLQYPVGDRLCLMVRTTRDQTGVAVSIRNAIVEVDSGQAVYDIKSMRQVIADWTFPQRIMVWLLGAFAALALFLAGAGIYGVMAYSVTRRTSELGIRMALGATRSDLVKGVLKGGLLIALSGLVVGLAAGLGLARLMAAILYGVPPSDPPSFATAFLLLLSISLAACYLPARRAARVDPVISLRHE
jgi:putative ABC transport system permease protein